MSRKGIPIDDSPIENWHALLKKESLYNNNITSLQEKEKNLHKKRKIIFSF